MLLLSLGALVWFAVLVILLGVCGVAAGADDRDRRLAAAPRSRRRPGIPRRTRVRLHSGSPRSAALR